MRVKYQRVPQFPVILHRYYFLCLKRLSNGNCKEILDLKREIQSLDTNARDNAIAVMALEVKKGVFKNPFKVQGIVKSDRNVLVSPEVPAKIIRLHVKEGQNVSKGQIIATLDGRTANAQIRTWDWVINPLYKYMGNDYALSLPPYKLKELRDTVITRIRFSLRPSRRVIIFSSGRFFGLPVVKGSVHIRKTVP